MWSLTCGIIVVKHMTWNMVRDVWNAFHEEHNLQCGQAETCRVFYMKCDVFKDVGNAHREKPDL